MQTRLSIVSNIVFKYFIIFAITFLWLNFYSQNNPLVITISIISSFTIGKIIGLLSNKKKNKIKLSSLENKKIKDISFQLLTNSTKDNLIFFHILLKSKNNVEINFKNNQIDGENFVFIPLYNSFEISEKDLLNSYKNNKSKKIIISCISYSQNIKVLADTFKEPLNLLDINQTFSLMKKYDLYPELTTPITPTIKWTLKDIKKVFFARQNSKHYLFSAIIILITSFFIKYNIYYIIFATLLFIFSGISRFKPNIKKSSIIDEL